MSYEMEDTFAEKKISGKKERLKHVALILARVAVYGFAVVGFVLVVGYFAVKFHLTDVMGRIDLNDRYLAGQAGNGTKNATSTAVAQLQDLGFGCKVIALKKYAPTDAARIIGAYQNSGSSALALKMIGAIALHAATGTSLRGALDACDAEWADGAAVKETTVVSASGTESSIYPWIDTPEWTTLAAAIRKDATVINKVSEETGVPSRLIASQLIGEQLRLYNTEREFYKSVFAPLNLLGSETQFSLGVTGIKSDTAIAVEQNLADSSSEYYPGAAYVHLLDFTTSDHDTERYDRITDQHNHYYAYLYTALFIKEVETQWKNAGYDISGRPDIISTLYNLGFAGSHPNADPHVGGSIITVGGTSYTFGSLGYEFYYSGELEDIFPYGTRG